MSHISEFLEQANLSEAPLPRRENIASAWDCFTTASKTARAYRSQKKSCNRRLHYAADIIAANEEFEHPESTTFITNTAWNVHRVSPLWKVKYKTQKNLSDSELIMAHTFEYDEGTLKRYAAVIRSFMDNSDRDDAFKVKMSPLQGLRGSRNDRDALKIEVTSAHNKGRRVLFIGILCGVETVELQISSTDSTVLPVLLTSGNLDLTERVIHGLSKCFDTVISPLLFSDYELQWVAALWTGLSKGEEDDDTAADIECTIEVEPRTKKQRVEAGSNFLTSTRIEKPPTSSHSK